MEHFSLFLFAVLVVFSGAHGYLMDDPCNIFPLNAKDTIIKSRVPAGCHNGTVDWDYPQGHLMLHFPNPAGAPTSICLQDWAIANAFAFTDVTDGVHRPFGNITRDHYTCGTKSKSVDIVLKVDAPEYQLYMGGFSYLVQRHA